MTDDYIADDTESFSRMGQTLYNADVEPVPVQMSQAEMERLSFPGEQHQSQVQDGMETVIREQRDWNSVAANLFWQMATELRQHRQELDHIRGYMERSRL